MADGRQAMTVDRCAACGSQNWAIAGHCAQYELADCLECGLTFTRNPDYSSRRYLSAYGQGQGPAPVAEQYRFVYSMPAKRLELESLAFFPPAPRLTPAQKMALAWLKARLPAKATVLDFGCGSGQFLQAIRQARFRAVGVEVVERLVRMLRQRGFETIVAAGPDFPWKVELPLAITLFDVLEHFPEPMELIEALKGRFSGAKFLASVPSPVRADLLLRGERGLSDFPPNHFLRWTPKALVAFFQRAGFAKVTVELPAPVGSELMPGAGRLLASLAGSPRSTAGLSRPGGEAALRIGRLGATALLWMQRAYQVSMDVAGALRAGRARRKGASAHSMLVIAE